MEIIFIATMMETAIVVLLVAIVFLAGQLARGKSRRKRALAASKLLMEAVVAKAVVLAVEQTGLFMNHHPQVKVQMQVIPERGKNFIVEIKEVLSFLDLAHIHNGALVTVKYNPSNVKEIKLLRAA